jgi:dUTPase
MLYFTKIRDVKSPTRGTSVSSWLDFYIPNELGKLDVKVTPTLWVTEQIDVVDVENKKIMIPAWHWVLIPSWLKVQLEEWDENYTYEMVLYNKSWVAVKYNLLVWANVIDNDYRWEFNIHLINCWSAPVRLDFGQKIVQWIIRRVYLEQPEEIALEVYEANANTERGEWWFGSTWTK